MPTVRLEPVMLVVAFSAPTLYTAFWSKESSFVPTGCVVFLNGATTVSKFSFAAIDDVVTKVDCSLVMPAPDKVPSTCRVP